MFNNGRSTQVKLNVATQRGNCENRENTPRAKDRSRQPLSWGRHSTDIRGFNFTIYFRIVTYKAGRYSEYFEHEMKMFYHVILKKSAIKDKNLYLESRTSCYDPRRLLFFIIQTSCANKSHFLIDRHVQNVWHERDMNRTHCTQSFIKYRPTIDRALKTEQLEVMK